MAHIGTWIRGVRQTHDLVRGLCSGILITKHPIFEISGSKEPYSEWYLGPETVNVGCLEPPGHVGVLCIISLLYGVSDLPRPYISLGFWVLKDFTLSA